MHRRAPRWRTTARSENENNRSSVQLHSKTFHINLPSSARPVFRRPGVLGKEKPRYDITQGFGRRFLDLLITSECPSPIYRRKKRSSAAALTAYNNYYAIHVIATTRSEYSNKTAFVAIVYSNVFLRPHSCRYRPFFVVCKYQVVCKRLETTGPFLSAQQLPAASVGEYTLTWVIPLSFMLS